MSYEVEYSRGERSDARIQTHATDDPVACEKFLCDLLENGAKIHNISRDGRALGKGAFDGMIKSAAGMLAQEHVCKSLDCDSVEAHYRFGVPA